MHIKSVILIMILIEVAIVEFALVWRMSRKKRSFVFCLFSYVLLTAVAGAIMYFVAEPYFSDFEPFVSYMIAGLIYLFPAVFNFAGSWRSKCIVAFYSYSYIVVVISVALRIGYFCPERRFLSAAFISMTLIYAVTFHVFLKFSNSTIMNYVGLADNKQQSVILRHTFVSFALILLLNIASDYDEAKITYFLLYLFLLYFIFLTYKLMAYYLHASNSSNRLNEMAHFDRLTGLGNRRALKEKCGKILSSKIPFYLIFMDLDDFKSINDIYGHKVGDDYLMAFAKSLLDLTDGVTDFFRISGDEFICITLDVRMTSTLQNLSPAMHSGIKFRGVSVGCAKFPDDGSSIGVLMNAADKAMYNNKIQKHSHY